MGIAEKIFKGGLAAFRSLDNSSCGSSVYVSCDLDYTSQCDTGPEVPIVVCAFMVGNPFLVIESPLMLSTHTWASLWSPGLKHT